MDDKLIVYGIFFIVDIVLAIVVKNEISKVLFVFGAACMALAIVLSIT